MGGENEGSRALGGARRYGSSYDLCDDESGQEPQAD